MGLLSYLFYKILYNSAFLGAATYFAFRLGNELPIASRRAGRSLGMGYNYFKTTLKFFTPDTY
jgi:hypothetical protein